jgi:hypothetical protein
MSSGAALSAEDNQKIDTLLNQARKDRLND